jgi:hypothetical protein
MRRASAYGLGLSLLLSPRLAPAAETEANEPGEDPDVVLSEDTWYVRLDLSLAYTRSEQQFHPTRDDTQKSTLTVAGLGPAVQLGAGLRLGTDVTLGALGRVVHSPVTRWEGSWESKAQGMYYGELFIDHRLPDTVMRLGAGIGPGWVYTLGPAQEGYGGLGPVATLWFGLDLPTSSRVAVGLGLDATGSAINNSHSLGGESTDFSTFMLVVGLSCTLRISEPSWPKNMPALARL